MTDSLFYWCAGGAVCAGGRTISRADAKALFEIHLDEAQTSMLATRPNQALTALGLAEQLFKAITLADDWRRASTPA